MELTLHHLQRYKMTHVDTSLLLLLNGKKADIFIPASKISIFKPLICKFEWIPPAENNGYPTDLPVEGGSMGSRAPDRLPLVTRANWPKARIARVEKTIICATVSQNPMLGPVCQISDDAG